MQASVVVVTVRVRNASYGLRMTPPRFPGHRKGETDTMSDKEMTCEILAANLTDFLEGQLREADAVAAIAHLAACQSCEGVLVTTRQVVALAREQGRVPLGDDDRSRLLARLIEGVG